MSKIIHTLFFGGLCSILFTYCASADTCTLYKIGDNTITCQATEDELADYINDSYEWSIEPTTLMYMRNGESSWIWNSEVKLYESKGWSLCPPVVIYSATENKQVFKEEVDDYLATGLWFKTESEARPVTITMDAFTKTNLKPEDLEKILSKGLSGYGQAFYNMEQTYGINAIFAISVAELESGHGTSSSFRNKNNAFGIGPGKRFDSVEAGIEYFGQLMNKSIYCGKSVDKIGNIYCVGGNWANKVKALMKTNYSALGY